MHEIRPRGNNTTKLTRKSFVKADRCFREIKKGGGGGGGVNHRLRKTVYVLRQRKSGTQMATGIKCARRLKPCYKMSPGTLLFVRALRYLGYTSLRTSNHRLHTMVWTFRGPSARVSPSVFSFPSRCSIYPDETATCLHAQLDARAARPFIYIGSTSPYADCATPEHRSNIILLRYNRRL